MRYASSFTMIEGILLWLYDHHSICWDFYVLIRHNLVLSTCFVFFSSVLEKMQVLELEQELVLWQKSWYCGGSRGWQVVWTATRRNEMVIHGDHVSHFLSWYAVKVGIAVVGHRNPSCSTVSDTKW